MKESGWNSQRINSMKKSIYKTGEINDSSNVKKPLRSSALIISENDDKLWFVWSILAHLHPGEIGNPNRVSNLTQFSKN